jgi:hypothetical protein
VCPSGAALRMPCTVPRADHQRPPPAAYGGDLEPTLRVGYPCANGSTSLSRVLVTNRPDLNCRGRWGARALRRQLRWMPRQLRWHHGPGWCGSCRTKQHLPGLQDRRLLARPAECVGRAGPRALHLCRRRAQLHNSR